MEKLQQLYEGKAKKVFATDDPELLIVDYKDDATAFNGLKKGTIAGKGVINNQMSNRLMAYLEKQGIPTHFVKELSERETLVKKVSTFPPGPLPNATVWKRGSCSRNPPLNSPIKTTSWATRCSTPITPSL